MSLYVDIEKDFKGFKLKIKFETRANITGILGDSGSGKSMTLKCIAGIEKPDKGKIILNDRILFDSEKKIDIKTKDRKVGYLFQNYMLFPNMTVEQNILAGVFDRNYHEKILEKMISLFRLKGLEKRKPSEISGGQQQRVALARLFAYNPEIIMLDEPFSALDSTLKEHIQLELLNIFNNYNKDILIVTHDRDEAFRFCDDIVMVEQGNSIKFDSVKSIFSNPVYKSVAKMIGIKNIFKCTKNDEHSVYVPFFNKIIYSWKKVDEDISFVGIRARDIEMVENIKDDEHNYVEVEVINISHEFNFISMLLVPKNVDIKNTNEDLPYIMIKIPRNKWITDSLKYRYLRIKKHTVIPLKK